MQLTMKLDQELQDVLPVMTRAAAKREQERQTADDKASEESRAEPIAVEDLPEREDDSQQDDAEESDEIASDAEKSNGDEIAIDSEEGAEYEWCPTHLDQMADDLCDNQQQASGGVGMTLTRADVLSFCYS